MVLRPPPDKPVNTYGSVVSSTMLSSGKKGWRETNPYFCGHVGQKQFFLTAENLANRPKTAQNTRTLG